MPPSHVEPGFIQFFFCFRHNVVEILHDNEQEMKNIIDIGHKFKVHHVTERFPVFHNVSL